MKKLVKWLFGARNKHNWSSEVGKEHAMKNQVSRMLQRDGFEKSLKIVNETILEKQYSSTQAYWKVFKEELINQNKDE